MQADTGGAIRSDDYEHDHNVQEKTGAYTVISK